MNRKIVGQDEPSQEIVKSLEIIDQNLREVFESCVLIAVYKDKKYDVNGAFTMQMLNNDTKDLKSPADITDAIREKFGTHLHCITDTMLFSTQMHPIWKEIVDDFLTQTISQQSVEALYSLQQSIKKLIAVKQAERQAATAPKQNKA